MFPDSKGYMTDRCFGLAQKKSQKQDKNEKVSFF